MKNNSFFLLENFQFLEVKFSIYLNRRVFVMRRENGNKRRERERERYSLMTFSF